MSCAHVALAYPNFRRFDEPEEETTSGPYASALLGMPTSIEFSACTEGDVVLASAISLTKS